MDTQSTPAPQQAHQTKHNRTKILLCTLLVVALVAAASYVTYLWQQNKISKLDSSLASNQEKIDFLANQQSGLTQQLEAVSTKNAELIKDASGNISLVPSMSGSLEPIPDELEVTVTGAMRYPDSTYSAAHRTIVVDVEIKNSSTQTLSFLHSDFKVIDKNNNTSVNFGTLVGKTTPNGNVVLDSQSVAPGQTIKGAMLFSTLGEPGGNYTLVYQTQSRQFTIQ